MYEQVDGRVGRGGRGALCFERETRGGVEIDAARGVRGIVTEAALQESDHLFGVLRVLPGLLGAGAKTLRTGVPSGS